MVEAIDMMEEQENLKKRIKCEGAPTAVKVEVKIEAPKVKSEKCVNCLQYTDEVVLYNGHPNNSVEEYIALTDEKLLLFTGEETFMDQQDERPTNKITHFSVYDKAGHLCAFDSGLIESNKLLYFSGYIKAIYEEEDCPDGGIPAHDLGPINAWYIAGYDGGERAIVGFSTGYAEYYLMTPAPDYEPLMDVVNSKIALTKLVIEFLLEESWQSPNYEDLLQRLETSLDDSLTEEALLRHAQFICDQVVSFDMAAGDCDEDKPLITAPCMRALVKIAGVTFKQRKGMTRVENKGLRSRMKKPQWSKATTTNLVKEVFESFFTEQIANNDIKGPKKKRCAVCEACQAPDCGSCSHCRDMLKFGGSGRSKQACKQRRCPNMAIQDAEESDNEEEIEEEEKDEIELPCSKRIINEVKWVGEPDDEHNGRIYYCSAEVGDFVVSSGDYVVLNPSVPDHPLLVAKVCYMWEVKGQDPTFHAHVFTRGLDTILGETADPREIFMTNSCENCPLGSIVRKAEVEKRILPENWAENGGIDSLAPALEDDGKTFFYSKRYEPETARFEDLEEDSPTDEPSPCSSCNKKLVKKRLQTPTLEKGCVLWRGETYKVGSGVFLNPEVFAFNVLPDFGYEAEDGPVDEELYPEHYRKHTEVKGSNLETPQPFGIGLIEEINCGKGGKDVEIKVRKFYRPENTHKGVFSTYQSDLNLVYYSEEAMNVPFEEVTGKCYIAFGDCLTVPVQEWITQGPHRFYFWESYNLKKHSYEEIPSSAAKIGQPGKGKGKGKGKSAKTEAVGDVAPPWDPVRSPLACMDVFAGCGGLSEGLHQTGIARTEWAIEKEPAAAQAYKLNNPDTKVFTDDCNDILRQVMSGEGIEKGLPAKGQVQLLVGGPPCQGFSGMNRFNAGQYSLFKNSLIVSYLSYCDYYRPKYFVLENVRNFVSFKKSLVLKLTLRCLLAMGYQATFGIVQAGHYGVPQTRRRLIILAAAPGHQLPRYPDPQHVFSKRGCQLSVQVGDHKYTNGARWTSSAPFRTITVRDAMSDLPDIRNGSCKREMAYDSEPMSHFQRFMRAGNSSCTVRDHICKEMAPLVEARMAHIPLAAGSDWRDLPNIVVKLRDGTFTNKLRYSHRNKKQDKKERPKAVCQCATGKGGCDPSDRQFNTLIPWCLPHTGDRHNHWAGLYGRLEWDGFFSTTVTNPEPMGKQGRVLHPDQHRVVSIRECARSQGFPDRYQFSGTILDKHRQVGNAVPPPLGAALGREIRRAMSDTLKKSR